MNLQFIVSTITGIVHGEHDSLNCTYLGATPINRVKPVVGKFHIVRHSIQRVQNQRHHPSLVLLTAYAESSQKRPRHKDNLATVPSRPTSDSLRPAAQKNLGTRSPELVRPSLMTVTVAMVERKNTDLDYRRKVLSLCPPWGYRWLKSLALESPFPSPPHSRIRPARRGEKYSGQEIPWGKNRRIKNRTAKAKAKSKRTRWCKSKWDRCDKGTWWMK